MTGGWQALGWALAAFVGLVILIAIIMGVGTALMVVIAHRRVRAWERQEDAKEGVGVAPLGARPRPSGRLIP